MNLRSLPTDNAWKFLTVLYVGLGLYLFGVLYAKLQDREQAGLTLQLEHAMVRASLAHWQRDLNRYQGDKATPPSKIDHAKEQLHEFGLKAEVLDAQLDVWKVYRERQWQELWGLLALAMIFGFISGHYLDLWIRRTQEPQDVRDRRGARVALVRRKPPIEGDRVP